MNKKKLIYTSYSPNTRKKDLNKNFRLLLNPTKWITGDSDLRVKEYFKKYYPDSDAFVYNYARSAMYHFFINQEIEPNDEIIYQGYTCSAAIQPAIWAGLKPVYADIDEKTLCLDFENLKSLINEKTKYIVLQYTLGLSPDGERIANLAKEKGILLIEDCTHYLPYRDNAEAGMYGDVSIFSFGRDKIVSGVDGGVLLVNNKNLVNSIEKSYKKLPMPNIKWTFQRLLFPIIWSVIKKFYFSFIGKLVHIVCTKLGLLTRATTKEEKAGVKPDSIPARLPNSLGELALDQLNDIDIFQEHRYRIASEYKKLLNDVDLIKYDEFSIPPLRIPLLSEQRDELIKYCYDRGVNLGDWYSQPISPMEVDPKKLFYTYGMCPKAEYISKRIFNLPCHINISIDDCKRVVDCISELLKSQSKAPRVENHGFTNDK